jgi:hypothetical protein
MLTHSPIYFVASNFCNPHVLKYTPVAKVIAPCIWANLHSNTGFQRNVSIDFTVFLPIPQYSS